MALVTVRGMRSVSEGGWRTRGKWHNPSLSRSFVVLRWCVLDRIRQREEGGKRRLSSLAAPTASRLTGDSSLRFQV